MRFTCNTLHRADRSSETYKRRKQNKTKHIHIYINWGFRKKALDCLIRIFKKVWNTIFASFYVHISPNTRVHKAEKERKMYVCFFSAVLHERRDRKYTTSVNENFSSLYINNRVNSSN